MKYCYLMMEWIRKIYIQYGIFFGIVVYLSETLACGTQTHGLNPFTIISIFYHLCPFVLWLSLAIKCICTRKITHMRQEREETPATKEEGFQRRMRTPSRMLPDSCLPRSCSGAAPSASFLASRRPRFATSSDPSQRMREGTTTSRSTAAWAEEGRRVL
jgi:hypothetical protein